MVRPSSLVAGHVVAVAVCSAQGQTFFSLPSAGCSQDRGQTFVQGQGAGRGVRLRAVLHRLAGGRDPGHPNRQRLSLRSCEEITRAFDRSAGYGSGGAAVRV